MEALTTDERTILIGYANDLTIDELSEQLGAGYSRRSIQTYAYNAYRKLGIQNLTSGSPNGEAIAVARAIVVGEIDLSDVVLKEQEHLTPRELRLVLSYINDGSSPMNPNTQRSHSDHIYRKLDVHSRAAAIAQLLKQGQISMSSVTL